MIGKAILYIDISLLAMLCIPLLVWQIQVLRGRSMRSPDGSVDDWHDQKLCYGIAIADIFIAIPVTLVGVILVFLGRSLGFYLTGLAGFWFLWANVMATVTSLRFHKPKITLGWLLVFPLGAVVALIYIVWSILFFDEIFSILA